MVVADIRLRPQVRVIAGELVCAKSRLIIILAYRSWNQNIKLTEDFGFAPSTLVYQGKSGTLLAPLS